METDEIFDGLDATDTEGPAIPEPEPTADAAAAAPTVDADVTPAPPVATALPDAPATPAPAAAAATSPETAPTRQPQMVPLAAVLEERRRFEERLAQAEARLAQPQPPPAPAAEPVEFGEDPKGYVDVQTQAQKQALEALRREGEQIAQSVNQLRLSQAIGAAEAQIAAAQPDWMQALEHVRTVRTQQMQLMHPEATTQQIQAAIGQEEIALAQRELGAGRNPYALLYQVAKTYGYTAPAAAAAPVQAVAPTTARAPTSQPSANTLAPDLTLGNSGGTPDATSAADDDGEDMLEAAFSERYGPRKRA